MRNKKYYCSPVSDIIALQVEGPLCQSLDVDSNNSISINDVTETAISVDWVF